MIINYQVSYIHAIEAGRKSLRVPGRLNSILLLCNCTSDSGTKKEIHWVLHADMKDMKKH